jgi:hypothetical protein
LEKDSTYHEGRVEETPISIFGFGSLASETQRIKKADLNKQHQGGTCFEKVRNKDKRH